MNREKSKASAVTRHISNALFLITEKIMGKYDVVNLPSVSLPQRKDGLTAFELGKEWEYGVSKILSAWLFSHEEQDDIIVNALNEFLNYEDFAGDFYFDKEKFYLERKPKGGKIIVPQRHMDYFFYTTAQYVISVNRIETDEANLIREEQRELSEGVRKEWRRKKGAEEKMLRREMEENNRKIERDRARKREKELEITSKLQRLQDEEVEIAVECYEAQTELEEQRAKLQKQFEQLQTGGVAEQLSPVPIL